MIEAKILEEIGLTSAERKVYVTLLKLGSSTTGPIIKESKLHSSVIYYCLEKLIKLGVVCYVTKRKKKYFEAANPEKFLELLKERQLELKNFIPVLNGLKNTEKKKQEAYIYEGVSGAKEVFNDMLRVLKPGEEHVVFGASRSSLPLRDFLKRWNKRREQMGIKKRIILFESASEYIEDYKKQKLTKTKIMPKGLETPLAVDMYGHKTAIMLWAEYPIIVVIENQKITDGFKRYFGILWRISKNA